MSVMELGTKLVELCKQGDFMGAVNACLSEDVVSVEAHDMSGQGRETRGLEAVRAKNEQWIASNEVHGCEVEGPFPHGDRFAVTFAIDVTPKDGPMAGQRFQMKEVALYSVENGKVAREEFFYSMG